MGNEADKNNCKDLIMAQNSLVLNYKKVEYPPDLSIPPISYSDPDALLSLMFGSEPIRTFHGRLSRFSGDKYCLFKGLKRSENHLNKQANNFSFIRSKFLNP
jgi:hypothetical protein